MYDMGIQKFCQNMKVLKCPNSTNELYDISLICTKFNTFTIIDMIVPKDCTYMQDDHGNRHTLEQLIFAKFLETISVSDKKALLLKPFYHGKKTTFIGLSFQGAWSSCLVNFLLWSTGNYDTP